MFGLKSIVSTNKDVTGLHVQDSSEFVSKSNAYSEYGRRHILREHGKKRSPMQTIFCLNFFANAHYYYLD